MTQITDILIIGQGLAGTHLAFQALKQNKSILIIDNKHKHSSSIIAGGLINPIKGKRLVPLWKDHKELEKVLYYYKYIENILNLKTIKPIPQIRKLQTNETLNYYHKKKDVAPYPLYLKEEDPNSHHPELKNTPQPLIKVDHSYQVNTQTLLKNSRHYFQKKKILIDGHFNHHQLKVEDTHVEYKNIKAKVIVFCEGHQATQNPLWKNLAWENAKGNVLTFQSQSLQSNFYNLGKWIAPTADKQFKCGSTTEWDWTYSLCTKENYTTLTEFLKTTLSQNYTVTAINSGVRPILKDRTPIATHHPDYKNIWIINGLGSHGCFLAPLMSEKLLKKL